MDATAAEPSPPTRRRASLGLRREVTLMLVVAVLAAVVINTFFLQAFYIPSGSMEDTLVADDRIVVEKVSSWGGGGPERGDIVVFKDPGGWLDPSEVTTPEDPVTKALAFMGLYPAGGYLVKRVVGVGGDTVMCCDAAGRMVVNGAPLDESYLKAGVDPSDVRFSVEVAPGDIWVQGDNRITSWDSRRHLDDANGGAVPEELVVGRMLALVWPVGRAATFEPPDTFAAVTP